MISGDTIATIVTGVVFALLLAMVILLPYVIGYNLLGVTDSLETHPIIGAVLDWLLGAIVINIALLTLYVIGSLSMNIIELEQG